MLLQLLASFFLSFFSLPPSFFLFLSLLSSNLLPSLDGYTSALFSPPNTTCFIYCPSGKKEKTAVLFFILILPTSC
uniref:Uncharacterized protein n=1 Tax=Lepeophtheirus salmonis TaxID=72036 RepID=A0A0K2U8J3_LEPSM